MAGLTCDLCAEFRFVFAPRVMIETIGCECKQSFKGAVSSLHWVRLSEDCGNRCQKDESQSHLLTAGHESISSHVYQVVVSCDFQLMNETGRRVDKPVSHWPGSNLLSIFIHVQSNNNQQ